MQLAGRCAKPVEFCLVPSSGARLNYGVGACGPSFAALLSLFAPIFLVAVFFPLPSRSVSNWLCLGSSFSAVSALFGATNFLQSSSLALDCLLFSKLSGLRLRLWLWLHLVFGCIAFSGRTIVALWPSWLSASPGSLALLALWLLALSPFGFFFASGPCALLRDFVPRFGPLCFVLGFCAFACDLLAFEQSVLWNAFASMSAKMSSLRCLRLDVLWKI